MNKRIKRSRDDLKAELHEQMGLLRHSCIAYDQGYEGVGRDIATRLRLLINHWGNSRSLLEQLSLRSQKKFFTTASPLNDRNLLPEFNLLALRFGDNRSEYVPRVWCEPQPEPPKLIAFVEWWNEPVIKDGAGRKMSRRELVEAIANTDGGAHVDPSLDAAYMDLSRNNSLGFVRRTDAGETPLDGKPHFACMRQIAHELLLTLHARNDEFSASSIPVPYQPK